MKNNLLLWQIGGLTFTAILGTVLHFLYQWTGLKVFAPFSSVNESTWEHMKLVFVPSLLFALFQSIFASDYECFWLIKLCGITLGTLLVPILFYTLSGAFGTLPDLVNIALFFVSIIIQYLVEMVLFNKLTCPTFFNWLSIGLLVSAFILFTIFTFSPPRIPLFLDPVTSSYGIIK